MISRSDGRNFHLLLADHPLPFPPERSGGPTRMTSVCFWYVYGAEKGATKSTVVVFECRAGHEGKIFRQIEFIANILADELLRRRDLAVFYNLRGDSILELSY
jgi:hypothetical protein